jgi:hypothetical protein
VDEQFLEKVVSFRADPLGFAHWAYPWREPGELLKHDGPDTWQTDLFGSIGEKLQRGDKLIMETVRSGHGVGKSAGSSILIDWGMSTLVGTKGVVTANTERQLRTKTWVELSKWRRLSITRELFKIKATSMYSVDPDMSTEWRFDMAPWSERNTEAFAGLHNLGNRIILVMDEASAIPDLVHEVAEGAMTDEDTEIIWVMFGNPTKNTGRFREAFLDGKFAHRWTQHTVDSRTSRFTNKKLIDQWIKDYGIDHDFVRVRVLGEFPKHDVSSFIAREDVINALAREANPMQEEPVVIGVDVARFGDDRTVLFPRQGRDAKTRPLETYQGLDTMQIVERVTAMFQRYNAQMIYVDGGGIGAGVVDRLRQLNFPVHEVQFGSKADNYNQVDKGIRYANKRAEIWGGLRDWLKTGSLQDWSIDQDYTILDDLTLTNYYYVQKTDALILEPKSEIKRREGRSPDVADALACTFAAPHMHQFFSFDDYDSELSQDTTEYNPYEHHRSIINGRHTERQQTSQPAQYAYAGGRIHRYTGVPYTGARTLPNHKQPDGSSGPSGEDG